MSEESDIMDIVRSVWGARPEELADRVCKDKHRRCTEVIRQQVSDLCDRLVSEGKATIGKSRGEIIPVRDCTQCVYHARGTLTCILGDTPTFGQHAWCTHMSDRYGCFGVFSSEGPEKISTEEGEERMKCYPWWTEFRKESKAIL